MHICKRSVVFTLLITFTPLLNFRFSYDKIRPTSISYLNLIDFQTFNMASHESKYVKCVIPSSFIGKRCMKSKNE